MAEALLGKVVEGAIGKLLSLPFEEIGFALGVKNELNKLEKKLMMIQALLSDAQSKQLTTPVQRWLKNLESIALDADIVLDEFGYEILCHKIETRKRDEVRRFFSFSNPLSFRVMMAHKIKNIMISLEEAFKEANQIGVRAVELTNTHSNSGEIRLTHPFVDDTEIVGRDGDISSVKRMLTSSNYEKDLPVVAIVGMGGQGKTTLAQLVYKNDTVVRHFDERIWFCVSDDFKVERLLNEMLQSLTGNKVEMTNREALVKELQKKLKDKRYLLVLDDVWNENQDEWESMRNCLLGIGGSKESKILVTTRSDSVAEVMRSSDCHHLQIISGESSWMLLEKIAFGEGGATRTQALVDIGRRIVRRCGGVPLAIKAVGGLLYSKKDASEWLEIDRSTEIWNSATSGVDRALSAIQLSYDHLPSYSLKQCFAACSIFPKDTLLNKDKLVQIWMAQGLINPPNGSDLQMEDIGSNYVNVLLRSSLLQDPEKDLFNNITWCKMHDLVHDFSLQVSKNYCFNMEVESHETAAGNDIKAVHLLLIFGKQKTIKKENLKGIPSKLRTLILNGSAYLEDILVNFRYLSTLIVQDSEVDVLPTAVGEMKLLRYLDIADTVISRLPDSFTMLYNLQTLRVTYLEELPKGFGNLINLRNFYMTMTFFLSGIRHLTNLRTLPPVVEVVRESKGFQLEELEYLDNLRGKLKIQGLENVSRPESAAKANLWRKSSIQMLELCWDSRQKHNSLEILEGLKPHANLKSLTIEGFHCSTFPSWMVTKDHLSALCNLVNIELRDLPSCKQIPSLGNLPHLQIILISMLHSVECIGHEIYGCTNLDGASTSSNSHETAVATLFPALRKLQLVRMYGLLEWSDAMIQSNSSAIKLFPVLEELDLFMLPNLGLLPNLGDLKCLRRLTIRFCENLTRLPISKGIKSLQELTIVGCRNLTSLFSEDFDEGLQGFGSIECIHLEDCLNLVGVPEIHNLQSLHQLTIRGSDRVLKSWTRLETLTSLEDLTIYASPRYWPTDLQDLSSLTSLRIGCYDNDNEPLDYFPWHDSTSGSGTSISSSGRSSSINNIQRCFVSLTSLELRGWRNLKSLPESIQYISALRDITIEDFQALEALPEWLGDISCLESLKIWGCKNLKQLPSVEVMQCLTNLQKISIRECPLLRERCTKYSGAEWHKIAHIPNIDIRGIW
ncbi:hypothetical protein ACH5RR_040388 [Cinchona calisaya]|uniref:Uncharacterized protein n=1 Tax=Cinchona calisaya TaxID=153742 RepID=A0ABD2XSV8_9GENT